MTKVNSVNKEKFEAYVTVQNSGVTNMFDLPAVMENAAIMCGVELTKGDCLYVMENYGELKKKYEKKEEHKFEGFVKPLSEVIKKHKKSK